MTLYGTRSASALRSYNVALETATNFSNMYDGMPFVVMHYPADGTWDVEPAKPLDRVGDHFVKAIVFGDLIQDSTTPLD